MSQIILYLYIFISDAEVPSKPCINGGSYNVTELSLKGKTELCDKNGFNQVSIYCQDPEMIKFLKDCTNEVRDSGTYQKKNLLLSVKLWSLQEDTLIGMLQKEMST